MIIYNIQIPVKCSVIWDGDKEPPSCKLHYGHLSDGQKAAAAKIGYTPATWDDEDDGKKLSVGLSGY